MKITKHISFFYLEHRIIYINSIIDETNKYKYRTDIFIHTNNPELEINTFNNYSNGTINIIYHNLSDIHPYYLTWKCRELLQKQKDDYDIFMYIEDDILVPTNALEYWLEYNEKLIELNYNLGFLRIEVDNKNDEYITDIYDKFDTSIILDIDIYCVNNKNEFNKFINSAYYSFNNDNFYGIREYSAFGLHGLNMSWYKNTLIPIKNNKLIIECKIYHMQNNYVNDNTTRFAKIKFNEGFSQVNTI